MPTSNRFSFAVPLAAIVALAVAATVPPLPARAADSFADDAVLDDQWFEEDAELWEEEESDGEADDEANGDDDFSAGEEEDARGMDAGENKARAVALERTGPGEVVLLNIGKRRGDRAEYTFLVVGAEERHTVTVNSGTGEIVSLKSSPIVTITGPGRKSDLSRLRETTVDPDDAVAIAMENAEEGVIAAVDKEYRRNGRVIYTVTVIEGKRRRVVRIDADSGTILSEKTKRLHSHASRRAPRDRK